MRQVHGEIATPVASDTTLTASEKAQKNFLSMVSGEISLSSSVALTSLGAAYQCQSCQST